MGFNPKTATHRLFTAWGRVFLADLQGEPVEMAPAYIKRSDDAFAWAGKRGTSAFAFLPQGYTGGLPFNAEAALAMLTAEKLREEVSPAVLDRIEKDRLAADEALEQRVKDRAGKDSIAGGLDDWDVACVLAQALQMAMPLIPEYTGQGEFAQDDVEMALKAFTDRSNDREKE